MMAEDKSKSLNKTMKTDAELLRPLFIDRRRREALAGNHRDGRSQSAAAPAVRETRGAAGVLSMLRSSSQQRPMKGGRIETSGSRIGSRGAHIGSGQLGRGRSFPNVPSLLGSHPLASGGRGRGHHQQHNQSTRGRNASYISRNIRGRIDNKSGNKTQSEKNRFEELSNKSNREVVLALANQQNCFEELIREKLDIKQFKIILKLLKKVSESEFDKNKGLIMIQACQPEFLEQFSILVMQGICLPSSELEQLLSDMQEFFETVLKLLPNTACDKLRSHVMGCQMCINGLVSQGTIKLDQKILTRFKSIVDDLDKLKLEFETKNCNVAKESKKERMELVPPPDNFREMSIYPNIEDVTRQDFPYLRANKVQGRYQDVEHYLDTQFRLLREDYVRPLRDGIADFLHGKSTRKCESQSVRLYHDIRFLRYIYEEDKQNATKKPREGNLISFQLPNNRNLDWEFSKRFMHGALLCFTSNNFESLLFATVADRNVIELRKGELLVKFCEKYDENIYKKKSKYLMVESEVYFEPYYQVLKTLQTFDEQSFPMSKYIIEMQATDSPPLYLNTANEAVDPFELPDEKKELPVKCVIRNVEGKKFRVTVLDESTWPSAENLGLDASQLRALHAALTRELAVIQGPPGTGKTFMALKIAQTLIENREATGRDTPILVVCLTNHALDQFLEGILKFTNKLVRIGGQSRSVMLEPYNLKRQRRNRSHHFLDGSSQLFRNLLSSVEETRSEIERLKKNINQINDNAGIVTLKYDLASIIDQNVTAGIVTQIGKQFLTWLCGFHAGEDSLYMPEGQKFISFYSLRGNVEDYEKKKLKLVNDEKCNLNQDQVKQIMAEIATTVDFRNNVIDILEYLNETRKTASNEQTTLMLARDAWQLNLTQRWQVYSYWVNQAELKWQKQLRINENKIFHLRERIEELRFHDDLAILRHSNVVGMTTTGAARLHELLKKLGCQIVIVEEAAEVMEAHVVACLTNHCQHLILIGDHKQLRPSIAVYALGLHFNFDVSLFERMVRNRGQCVTLGVQHRMAPDMARLIVPTIYPSLANDSSVLKRPKVPGVPHRLFFITHNQPEQQDTEMSSRRNEHEAHFLLALCDHLLLQGFTAEQITILATYRGQMFFIKKEQRKYEHHRVSSVLVTVVDNFQGEENEVILLSLVRSNEENRIGFLATENRVCVALSRARQALYIIGNMEGLASASPIWQAMRSSLEEQSAIGGTLALKCQVHPDQTCEVSTPQDFKRFSPEGGCLQVCTVKLNCGHNCDKICHSLNRDHENIRCSYPCMRNCMADLHPCLKLCFKDCGSCYETVEKTLPCGHQHPMKCHMDPENFPCNVKVEKKFADCNHKAVVQCFDSKCPLPCENRLPCGHACILTCHPSEDPDHMDYKCRKSCDKLNKDCSADHICEKRCYQQCETCQIKIKKKKSCGHELNMKCSSDPEDVKCYAKCTRKLTKCNHPCTRLCHEECEPCNKMVRKAIPSCNHSVSLKCSEEPLPSLCTEKCERQLKCGHQCTRKCAEPCTSMCKRMAEVVEATCGHQVALLCWEKSEGLSQPSVDRCRESCGAKLECGHMCLGSCSECQQGRFHVACKELCARELVCGHSCPAPCDIPCPPCTQKCKNRCAHEGSHCKNTCGLSCKPCKIHCTWHCEHDRCRNQCGQLCSRQPCTKPCKKSLRCGHLCAGFCGEMCPHLCWTCDRSQLTKEAFEVEVEVGEEPRFVYLPDCGHVLEVYGLERWLSWQDARLSVRTCPRCEKPITRLHRYRDHTKTAYQDFAFLHSKMLNNATGTWSKQKKLEETLRQLERTPYLQDSHGELQKYLAQAKATVNKQPGKKQQMFNNFNMLFVKSINSLDIQMSIVSSICSILNSCPNVSSEGRKELNQIIKEILNMLEVKKTHLAERELQDFSAEVMRLQHLARGLSMLGQKGNRDLEEELKAHTRQTGQYSVELQQAGEKIVEKMSQRLGVTCRKMEIKIKVPMTQVKSFWSKCPNGHLNFREFIPAVDKNVCEECKTEIKTMKCPIFKRIETMPITKKEVKITSKKDSGRKSNMKRKAESAETQAAPLKNGQLNSGETTGESKNAENKRTKAPKNDRASKKIDDQNAKVEKGEEQIKQNLQQENSNKTKPNNVVTKFDTSNKNVPPSGNHDNKSNGDQNETARKEFEQTKQITQQKSPHTNQSADVVTKSGEKVAQSDNEAKSNGDQNETSRKESEKMKQFTKQENPHANQLADVVTKSGEKVLQSDNQAKSNGDQNETA